MHAIHNIIFYVTGHGFGHATRSSEIINALSKALKGQLFVHIRSNAPRWIFSQNVTAPFEYHFVSIDVGAVQRSFFDVDTLNTLRDSYKFYLKKKNLVKQEVNFIRENNVSLILADIPPVAFDIAQQAKIPGIAIGNFSWDWIYQPYTSEYPQFAKVVAKIKESYNKADLLLQLPFSTAMPVFKKRKKIPMIARKATADPGAVLHQLGIDKIYKDKLILLAFGGLDAAGYIMGGIKKCPEYLFAIPTDQPIPKLDNVITVNSHSNIKFLDLVNTSRLVIGKPGYGLVSECIVNRTPLLYTDRDNFLEYGVMKKQLPKCLPCARIPRYYLFMGEWKESIDYFYKTPLKWPKVPANGADVAAEIIKKYL